MIVDIHTHIVPARAFERIVKAGYDVPPDVVARLKTMVGFGGKK